MAAGKPTNPAADTVLLSKNRNCTVENEPQLQYFWWKVEFALYKSAAITVLLAINGICTVKCAEKIQCKWQFF